MMLRRLDKKWSNFITTKPGKPDKILVIVITLLILIGIVALFSASLSESRDAFGSLYRFFVHQVTYGLTLGLAAAFLFYITPLRKIKKLALPFFLFSMVLMLMVFIPGLSVSGATANRWLDIGLFTFQPSELLKLSSILYLAALLETRYEDIKQRSVLVAFTILLASIALVLISQPDFSTLVLIVIIGGIIYFVAGAPWKYIAVLVIGALLVGLAMATLASYRFERIQAFLNPRENTNERSFHVNQAEISLGSGKFVSFNFADGLQHRRLLPEPMNDSIFAVWGDETGFVGASFVVLLYSCLVGRILFIASRTRDIFSRLTLVGIGSWIFLQAFINMGAMLQVMPLTGISLPYISYGSSSLITVLIASGIVLQLSKRKT